MVHYWNASEAAEAYDGGVVYNVQLLGFYALLLVDRRELRGQRTVCHGRFYHFKVSRFPPPWYHTIA